MACHDVWLAAFSQGTCDSAPLGTGRSEWVMHLFAGILPRHGEQTPCGRFKGHKKYKALRDIFHFKPKDYKFHIPSFFSLQPYAETDHAILTFWPPPCATGKSSCSPVTTPKYGSSLTVTLRATTPTTGVWASRCSATHGDKAYRATSACPRVYRIGGLDGMSLLHLDGKPWTPASKG
ncbi:hypothetical protein HDV63DRAFT_255700 [Trichoderma sp. SZMC 28014]